MDLKQQLNEGWGAACVGVMMVCGQAIARRRQSSCVFSLGVTGEKRAWMAIMLGLSLVRLLGSSHAASQCERQSGKNSGG